MGQKRYLLILVLVVSIGVSLWGNQLVAARAAAGMGEPDAMSRTVPGVVVDPAADVEEQEPVPQILSYTVVAGDSLGAIAAKYGTDTSTLMALNSLTSSNLLQVGKTIRVLTIKGVVHKVTKGDTLWDISMAYKVDSETIQKANPEMVPAALRPGDELIIPGGRMPDRTSTVSRGASSRSSSSSSSSTSYAWPVKGRITSGFGLRSGGFHEAIDIGVPTGTTVRAARAGKVTFSGWASGYGYLVKISHGNGYETRYAHNSKLLVNVGQQVEQGQAIAYSGSTGNSTGPHLHFEIRKNGVELNPISVLP